MSILCAPIKRSEIPLFDIIYYVTWHNGMYQAEHFHYFWLFLTFVFVFVFFNMANSNVAKGGKVADAPPA